MIVSHEATAARAGESPHRPGGIGFVNLLTGQEGTLDNFVLALVDITSDFHAPRHRHNFEQVRIMLEGRMQFDAGQVQEAGSIGYFCEGTYYTQQGTGASRTLLLQVAGPAGNGYMSRTQMDDGVKALQERGRFAKGVYSWTDAAGQAHNKDGYEAIWEHVFGRRIEYETPRYQSPVLIWPEAFRALPSPKQDGVSEKHLGSFNERGLELAQIGIRPDSTLRLDAADRPLVLFVIRGTGEVCGTDGAPHEIGRNSAIFLDRGERATLRAEAECQLYRIGLPIFDDLLDEPSRAAA